MVAVFLFMIWLVNLYLAGSLRASGPWRRALNYLLPNLADELRFEIGSQVKITSPKASNSGRPLPVP